MEEDSASDEEELDPLEINGSDLSPKNFCDSLMFVDEDATIPASSGAENLVSEKGMDSASKTPTASSSDISPPAPLVPYKKGEGILPLQRTDSTTPAASSFAISLPATQVSPKRGRGRPKKSSSTTLTESSSTAISPPPTPVPQKRGRGRRPLKHAASTNRAAFPSSISPSATPVALKRLRGRPKNSSSTTLAESFSAINPRPTTVPQKRRGRGRPSKQSSSAADETHPASDLSKAASSSPAKRGGGRLPKLPAAKRSKKVCDKVQKSTPESSSDSDEEAIIPKHTVMGTPSGRYLKELVPTVTQWRRQSADAARFMQYVYDDYLAASS